MTVRVRGELTRTLKPGDCATIAGVYMPEPYTGYRAMKAGLVTRTYLEALSISKDKQTYAGAVGRGLGTTVQNGDAAAAADADAAAADCRVLLWCAGRCPRDACPVPPQMSEAA